MLAGVNETLAKKGMDVTVTDEVKNYLIDKGYDKTMGPGHCGGWWNKRSVTR